MATIAAAILETNVINGRIRKDQWTIPADASALHLENRSPIESTVLSPSGGTTTTTDATVSSSMNCRKPPPTALPPSETVYSLTAKRFSLSLSLKLVRAQLVLRLDDRRDQQTRQTSVFAVDRKIRRRTLPVESLVTLFISLITCAGNSTADHNERPNCIQ